MDLNLWIAFSALVVIPPLSPDTSDAGVVVLVVVACGQWYLVVLQWASRTWHSDECRPEIEEAFRRVN